MASMLYFRFMFTHQIRQAITAAFNHSMDKQARIDKPDLTELERFEGALRLLIEENGLIKIISENDLNHALSSAERGHFARMRSPARNGAMLTDEQAAHANEVVYSILDIFQDIGVFNNSNGMIDLETTLSQLQDTELRTRVESRFSRR